MAIQCQVARDSGSGKVCGASPKRREYEPCWRRGEFGCPTRLCVDPVMEIADDEYGFLITDFKVLSKGTSPRPDRVRSHVGTARRLPGWGHGRPAERIDSGRRIPVAMRFISRNAVALVAALLTSFAMMFIVGAETPQLGTLAELAGALPLIFGLPFVVATTIETGR